MQRRGQKKQGVDAGPAFRCSRPPKAACSLRQPSSFQLHAACAPASSAPSVAAATHPPACLSRPPTFAAPGYHLLMSLSPKAKVSFSYSSRRTVATSRWKPVASCRQPGRQAGRQAGRGATRGQPKCGVMAGSQAAPSIAASQQKHAQHRGRRQARTGQQPVRPACACLFRPALPTQPRTSSALSSSPTDLRVVLLRMEASSST